MIDMVEQGICAKVYFGDDGQMYREFCAHPALNDILRNIAGVPGQRIVIPKSMGEIPSGADLTTRGTYEPYLTLARCRSNGTGSDGCSGCNVRMTAAVIESRKKIAGRRKAQETEVK